MPTLTGLDRIARRGSWAHARRRRAGVVAHQASVDRRFRFITDILKKAGVAVTALFAPEHGIAGTEQDLKLVADDRRDRLTVRSLYGEHLGPTAQMLEGLDLLIFDLQDVGSRYYTYISTMLHCMRACAAAGIELVILDRPNPIGGHLIEGNLIESTHLSYVGVHPLPARHGMTVGEIARMMAAHLDIEVKLTVVAVTGWERGCWYDEIDRPWVIPSPNMPTLDTATVYPGMCLLEGTNISEGRGTTRPFEIFGAPWIDQGRMLAQLLMESLPGVVFRPLHFKPTFNKYNGEVSTGFQLHVTDRERFRPYITGIAILRAALSLHPAEFRWRQPPYEFEHEKLPIDILLGSTELRKRVEAAVPLREIERGWKSDLDAFARMRRTFLLY